MNQTQAQEKAIPSPGYRLADVSAAYQHYEVLDPDTEDIGEDVGLQFVWDWRIVGPHRFEVFFGVRVIGNQERPEKIDIRLVGSFATVGDSQALKLEDFSKTSAPAILLPYLREKVTKLSSDGPFGTYWMPLVNVQNLMDGYDYQASTGAKQLAEDSEALDRELEEEEEITAEES